MNDYLVKAYAFNGTVRIYSAHTTNLVEEARQIHDTWPAATAAFGRVLTASVIMGAMYKEDQTLSIQIDGKGPIGKIITTTNARGEVRGLVANPHVHASTTNDKLAVGYVVGNDGFIHVTKDVKIRDTFTSSAELQTGEIADDFTYYFAMSEQIPSSVALGVLVDPNNQVISSGGFILQLMPGTKPETIDIIEQNIAKMKPLSEYYSMGFTPEMILNEITLGDHQIVETMPLKYSCDCNRERFEKGLISLGDFELQEMINDNKPIETVCQFCGKKYDFTPTDLNELLSIVQNKKNEISS